MPLWRRHGSLASVHPIESSAPFDLALLVKEASDIEDSGLYIDDLEKAHGGTDRDTRPKRPCSPSPPTASNTQSHRNKKRAAKQRMKIEQEGHAANDRMILEHVQLSETIKTEKDAASLPTDSSGFAALQLRERREDLEREHMLQDLLDDGFTLVEWDGQEARPLVDIEGRIFAVLAGMPYDDTYLGAVEKAYCKIKLAGEKEEFLPEELKHRRGHFPALPFGISYGMGQGYVRCLNTGEHGDLIDMLLADEDLERLASYADAAFQLWAPKLYGYYQEHMRAAEEHTGERRNFSRSVFACASMNFGPRVHSFKHCDCHNLPFGWCAIQALGQFDPKAGGHLVIWDLRLIVEFPPGATILLPSAMLAHSNTAVQEDETHLSFMQYTASGIFRWVENGFQTEEKLKSSDEVKYVEMCKLKTTCWTMGLGLYSKLDELLERI